MITVYFDDQCGLCSKEIAVYRRADKSNSFEWVGLSDQTLDLESEGLELVAALERLHVKDSTGRLHHDMEKLASLATPGTDCLSATGPLAIKRRICVVCEATIQTTNPLPARAKTAI